MRQLDNLKSDDRLTFSDPRQAGGTPLAAVPAQSVWAELAGQWRRSLAARNLSVTTIRNYTRTLTSFAAFALSHGAEEPEDVEPGLIEDFTIDGLSRAPASNAGRGSKRTASSVATDFRHLRVFFNWYATTEGHPSPMAHLSPPQIEERLPDVFTDDELRRLVAACAGRGFAERRDMAVMRLLLDTGMRRAELASLIRESFDLDAQTVTVIGKGNRERPVPYGVKTAEALDNYLRARARHPDRHLELLWLAAPSPGHKTARRGALGYSGIAQIVKRRAEQADVTNAYPHRFRHTAAHAFLARGGTEGDAMRLFGWRSRTMVDHYGASAAGARAVAAARKISAGDRI